MQASRLRSTERSFAQTFLKEHFARPLPHVDDVFFLERFVEGEAASLALGGTGEATVPTQAVATT
jgi:hypothetical protein